MTTKVQAPIPQFLQVGDAVISTASIVSARRYSVDGEARVKVVTHAVTTKKPDGNSRSAVRVNESVIIKGVEALEMWDKLVAICERNGAVAE